MADHQPVAGYPVVAGSTVAFSVNHDPRPGTGSRREAMRLFRHRTAPGVLNSYIRVRLNQLGSSMVLFDDFVKPDCEIWLLLPGTKPGTLFLYVDDELIQTTHYE